MTNFSKTEARLRDFAPLDFNCTLGVIEIIMMERARTVACRFSHLPISELKKKYEKMSQKTDKELEYLKNNWNRERLFTEQSSEVKQFITDILFS